MRWLLLLHPSPRARAYLQMIVHGGLRPDVILVQGNEEDDRSCEPDATYAGFDPNESLRETLSRASWEWVGVEKLDPNHEDVARAIRESGADLAVFSGGGVLSDATLGTAARWLHVHPGRLPDWRGSTCHYYGLLLEGQIEATAFFLEAGLDAGDVICRRCFRPDATWRPEQLDHGLDAWIRAAVLVDALRLLVDQPEFRGRRQNLAEGQMFYVIHPVLKHIATQSLGRICSHEHSTADSTRGNSPKVEACPFC